MLEVPSNSPNSGNRFCDLQSDLFEVKQNLDTLHTMILHMYEYFKGYKPKDFKFDVDSSACTGFLETAEVNTTKLNSMITNCKEILEDMYAYD